MMKMRLMSLLIAGLTLGGIGTAGAGAAMWWGQTHNGTSGYGYMMGRNASGSPGTYGGMMGNGSYGGMMGGYNTNIQTTPATGVTSIAIQNFAYQPANVQIKAGATLTWTNRDSAPHTVTFKDSSLKSSGILQQGNSFSYTFNTPGTYSYYCAVHPYMVATVTVTA